MDPHIRTSGCAGVTSASLTDRSSSETMRIRRGQQSWQLSRCTTETRQCRLCLREPITNCIGVVEHRPGMTRCWDWLRVIVQGSQVDGNVGVPHIRARQADVLLPSRAQSSLVNAPVAAGRASRDCDVPPIANAPRLSFWATSIEGESRRST
jgi:hypothetical protein